MGTTQTAKHYTGSLVVLPKNKVKEEEGEEEEEERVCKFQNVC